MSVPSFEEKVKGVLAKVEKTEWKYKHIKANINGNRSFEELFIVVLDLEEAYELLVPSLLPCVKNAAMADKVRKEGTDHYKKKAYLKALDRYNFSILTAPHPMIKSNEESESCYSGCDDYASPRIKTEKYGGESSDESNALAMGYANRSAVLIKLKMYDECLRDIDLALKYGYPEAFRKILEERRLKCLKAQEIQSAQQDVQKAACADSKQEINALSKNLLRMKLVSGPEELLNIVSDMHHQDAEELMWKNVLAFKEEEPPELADPNPKVPSLSSALSVSYVPSKGRCVMATRNIRPGEVLGLERAYCVSLQENSLLNHCASCLCFCVVPLPCPGCAKAIFCSESCRTKYLEEDHWIECIIRPSVIALGLENQNMIYKVLKNFTYHQLRDMVIKLQMEKHENPETFGFDKNGVYNSASYQAIHYLHTIEEKMPFDTLFSGCLLAFIFTRLLQLSNRFFVDENGQPFRPSREDLVKTGAVLLANTLKIYNNGHFVNNAKMGKTIASALFPALSLLNHECSPSAFGYNKGRVRILRAMKPISPGEEVTICYTKHFQEQGREDRNKDLEHYGFSCSCKACEKNWPLFSKLPIYELNSNADVARQEKRQILQRISNALVLSYKIRTTFTKNEKITRQEFDSLCESIEMMHKYVSVPCQNICNLQLSLLMCYIAGF